MLLEDFIRLSGTEDISVSDIAPMDEVLGGCEGDLVEEEHEINLLLLLNSSGPSFSFRFCQI